MTGGDTDEPTAIPPRLGTRDEQIIRGLLRGETNKELGAGLGISQKTIEWHLGRLYQRLGVQSRTELVATVQRNEWLDAEGERLTNGGHRAGTSTRTIRGS